MGEVNMNHEEKPETKKCPYCAEVVQIDTIKCKHCSEWLNNEAAVKINQPDASQFSFKQPVRNFVLLCILTFGIYEVYWL